MKTFTGIILGVLALAPASAQASTFVSRAAFMLAAPGVTVVEDFESAGPVDIPLPSLATASAIFVGQAGVPFPNVYVIDPTANNFALGGAPIGSKALVGNGDESFLINLTGARQAVGFDVFLNDLGPATVRFFAGATLIDEIDFAADASIANNRAFAGIVSPSAITSVTFGSTGGGWLNTGIDNFTTGTISPGVPEPASWALMMVGFGLVGAAARRRKASFSLA